MPRFRPGEFVSPSTSEEVVSLLKTHGSKTRILAGGTTFYEMAKRGMMPEVQQILDLSKLKLDYAKKEGSTVNIGSMLTLTDLMKSGSVNDRGYEAVMDFLTRFTPVQIRNLATVGGEICSGVPFLDLPAISIALSAKFKIVGSSGSRVVPAESFFLDYFLVDLKRGEYMAELSLPSPKGEKSASAFVNLKRTATDLSLVNVAIKLELSKDNKIEDASVGLGGMGNVPIKAREIESSLKGKKLEELDFDRALKSIENFNPTSSVHASPWYKKEVCRVLVKEAIALAGKRAMIAG
jgi:CO/xanthine dehydrogenase FAD-binding subunit